MPNDVFVNATGQVIRTSTMIDEHSIIRISEKTPLLQNIGRIVAGDTNSNILTFEMNRYYDGVDLLDKNIRFIVKNSNGIFTEEAVDLMYNATAIRFSWILSFAVTCQSGSVSAAIEIFGQENGLNYSLKTMPFTIQIENSLDATNITAQLPENWFVNVETRLTNLEQGSANSIVYNNPNFPNCTTLDSALDTLFAKAFYVAPSITSFDITPSDIVYEIGTTINNLEFNWTINKDIKSQTLTNCTLTDETVRTATYTLPLSSNKTFILEISDGDNTASASKTISFLNKIYWGSAAQPITYDDAFVLGLSNSKLTNSNKDDYDFDCPVGEYCYFATPVSMKISTAWVNGFQTDLEELLTIQFTNASGYTSDYTISRFKNTGLGQFTATVK